VATHPGPILPRDEIADAFHSPGVTLFHSHFGFFRDDEVKGGIERHFQGMTVRVFRHLQRDRVLAGETALDPLEFIRTVAVARITMPRSVVRLSAGREDMSEETQALCFLAGANSIFYGPRLLTTPNPGRDRDRELMERLGLSPMER